MSIFTTDLNMFEYMDRETIELYELFGETPLERCIRDKIWNDVAEAKTKKVIGEIKKNSWKRIGEFLFGEDNG